MTGDDREGLRRMYGDDLDDHAPEDFEEQSGPEEAPHDASVEEQRERAVIPAPDGYSQYWITISFMLRNSASWQCDACCIQLVDHPQFLHVHHIDRNRRNNDLNNLRVLCVLCHAAQPGHAHLADDLAQGEKDMLRDRQRLAIGAREAKRQQMDEQLQRTRESKERDLNELDDLHPPRYR